MPWYWHILKSSVGRDDLLSRVMISTLGYNRRPKVPLDRRLLLLLRSIASGRYQNVGRGQPVQFGYKAVDSMIPVGH